MTTRFGPYRLLRRIASGGMGEVYLAVLERGGGFAKPVALKTVLPTARADFTDLFESEATLAAMLNHVNIVQVFDHGCIDGKSFLTMELVEGPDLGSLLDAVGQAPFPPEVAAEVGVQALRGLAHAHERADLQGRPMGLVHRDVSPSNILISMDGQVKLADFGLARVRSALPQEGLLTGKYSYMSPEQTRGAEATPQSDLFSLSLVLYEMFTGARAFPLCDPHTETLAAIREGKCRSAREVQPDLPEALDTFLRHAMACAPAERFPSARSMAAALSEACIPCGPDLLSAFVRPHARGVPESALAPEPTEVAPKPVSPTDIARGGWKPTLLVLFVIAWGAALGWWVFHTPPAPTPAPGGSQLPRPPETFSVEPVASSPLQPVPRKVVPERAAPPRVPVPPVLVMTLEGDIRVQLNHRPVSDRRIVITKRRTHLIRMQPPDEDHPDVLIRLAPPERAGGSWRMAVDATPWMKISLGRHPVGQTPRSNLAVPAGNTRLVLQRDDRTFRFTLIVPGGS